MKKRLNLSTECFQKTATKLACALISSLVLSACGDGGGSSGDIEEDANVQAAITLLQPFVGIYQLQDGSLGISDDTVYLSIRLTANDGISEAALIDYDDEDNCIPQRFSMGEVTKDTFSNRVFMNDVAEFSEAELSLSGGNLLIETVDFYDIDKDDNSTETVIISGSPLAITEIDLGVTCQ